MSTVVAIAALVAAILFAWSRIKGAGQWPPVAGPGGLARPRSGARSEGSVIAAIDDPVTGAAVLMVAIANARAPVDDVTRTVIEEELRETTGVNPRDVVNFAIQAVNNSPDPDNASLRLTRMLNTSLTAVERQQLLDMITRVANIQGRPTEVQAGAITRLKTRLDLA